MITTKMTSKGQVTIPKEIRDKLELQPGDTLEFKLEDNNTVQVRAVNRSVKELFGMFKHKADRAYTVEEMNESIGLAVAESDKEQ